MANVISEFLVGLSIDTKEYEQGFKRATDTLQTFSSVALGVGATLAAAVAGMSKHLIIDFSKERIELGNFADSVGLTRDQVYGLREAMGAMGGSAQDASGLIKSISTAQAALQKGDVALAETLAKSGLNPDLVYGAKDSYQAILNIANALKGASLAQKVNIANALGLSPAALQLLIKGGDAVDDLAKKFTNNRHHTEEITDTARKFQLSWSAMVNNVQGSLDPLSTELTKFAIDFNEELGEAFGEGGQGREALKWFAENIGTIAETFLAIGALDIALKINKATNATYLLAKALAVLRGATAFVAPFALAIGAIGSVVYGMWNNYQNDPNNHDRKKNILGSDYQESNLISNILDAEETTYGDSLYEPLEKLGNGDYGGVDDLSGIDINYNDTKKDGVSRTTLRFEDDKDLSSISKRKTSDYGAESKRGAMPTIIQVNLDMDGEKIAEKIITINSDAFEQQRLSVRKTVAR